MLLYEPLTTFVCVVTWCLYVQNPLHPTGDDVRNTMHWLQSAIHAGLLNFTVLFRRTAQMQIYAS